MPGIGRDGHRTQTCPTDTHLGHTLGMNQADDATSDATADALAALGWTAAEAAQPGPGTPARVFAVHRSEILAVGVDNQWRVDLAPHRELGPIAVGDWLRLDERGGIVARLDRRTVIERKAAGEHVHRQVLAANVDVLLIVSSCNAEFSAERLERALVVACDGGVRPVIVLTKADLADDVAEYCDAARALLPGIDVFAVDAHDTAAVAPIRALCTPGSTVALFGSSGVGKSTLGNALGAGELATGAIREADAKGRHTTTRRSMHRLADGALLIDNPGVREVQLAGCDAGIAAVFADVLEAASACPFRDCSHTSEPDCGVLAALDAGRITPRRLASYRALLDEQARNAEILESNRQRARDVGHKYRKLNWSKRARRGQ